jgi:hypothetical protein
MHSNFLPFPFHDFNASFVKVKIVWWMPMISLSFEKSILHTSMVHSLNLFMYHVLTLFWIFVVYADNSFQIDVRFTFQDFD